MHTEPYPPRAKTPPPIPTKFMRNGGICIDNFIALGDTTGWRHSDFLNSRPGCWSFFTDLPEFHSTDNWKHFRPRPVSYAVDDGFGNLVLVQ